MEKEIRSKLLDKVKPTYPYAGAKKYLKIKHPFAEAYKELFVDSTTDWIKAYEKI